MQVDVGYRCLEQLGNLDLREPQRFLLKPALDACPPILGLVEDEFGLG
ncbi:MAG: hypothetical protein ACYCQL_03005 [Acidithiobacillus sp.]